MANSLNTVMGRIFDTMSNLLARFPAGPMNDLISGALLLTRRVLFIPVKLDSAPTVTSLNLPNAGTYGTGGEMTFVVNFDQKVIVANTDAAVPVEMNYELRGAKYVSGSGTQSLLFRLAVPENAWDTDGIDVGTVSSATGVRTLGWSDDPLKPLIVKKGAPTVSVSSALPPLDTSRIRVDALGPQIVGRSNLNVDSRGVSLTVTFDQPVTVTGKPTVPVSVNGVDRLLTYTSGNRSDTLTFKLAEAGVTSASFRPYTGDVIYLPEGNADIRDRLGNQIYTLEGNLDTPLIEDGNRLVVIGEHFERLGTLSAAQLTDILRGVKADEGERYFYDFGTVGPPFYGFVEVDQKYVPLPWPFLSDYDFQQPVPAATGVDIYRAAFRSSIPEQQRFTTAYGIAAIPTNAVGEVSVVEWQQPTVFNLANSAPSLAFTCQFSVCNEEQRAAQSENDFPRFDVAQFGGQGFAVIMPDPFGLGNSVDEYAYQVKGSSAQWSIDMHNASARLLEARNLQQKNLFLAGWSAGGNETANFLEKIESQGQTVAGATIASSPLSLGPAVRMAIFDPRPWPPAGYPPQIPENTGDAVWLNVATAMSAFSLGGYEGLPLTAYELLGKYYDAGRRFYTQDYIGSDFASDPNGVWIAFDDVNGVRQREFMPYKLTDLIVSQYSSSPIAYDQSSYAKLMTANGAGRVGWVSPVMMVYGQQDEVLSVPMGRSVYSWQQEAFGKQNIEFDVITAANHRGTYLAAMKLALDWFTSVDSQG